MELVYKFNFNKRGLDPNEFEACLTSKVDKLLEFTNLTSIQTLKKKIIKKVRTEVCVRENVNKTRLDGRSHRAKQNYRNRDVIRTDQDTPKKNKDASGGTQGRERKDRTWKKEYHKKQYELFSDQRLGTKFCDLFPDKEIREDGFFYFKGARKSLTTIECCNVIDKISADFLKDLSGLSQNNHDNYGAEWKTRLELASEKCQLILEKRLGLDWAIDNDLMETKSYDQWKNHVMVVISFAALWFVVEMITDKLDKLNRPTIMDRLRRRFRN